MKINYRWCVIEHRIGPRIHSEIMGTLHEVIYEKKKSKKSKISMQNNELFQGRQINK
jgi:hypothetical protein